MTTGWNDAFPYAVEDSDGLVGRDWQAMVKWLDQTLPNEWDYYNGEYKFKTERAKMLFLMRWL